MLTKFLTGKEDHPLLGGVPEELLQHNPEGWKKFYEARRKFLMKSQLDPLRYGIEFDIWKKADEQRDILRKQFPTGVIHELNLGGNRSSKSERAAKRVVEALIKKPGARWWCGDATEASSRSNQQRFIWKYLPIEWRNEETGALRRTKTTKIKYSVAGGFTENIFVCPNGSECEFKFYEQKTGSLQAVELDGFWGDELLPKDWIETIEYRLVNRNGILHLTFTPITGYSQTVAYYLDDAKTIEETDAELLPRRNKLNATVGYQRMPRVQICKDPRKRVIYFHTNDNPFGNYDGMREQVKTKGTEEIMMRVYGYTTKLAHAQFPMFDEKVHVISSNRFKQIILDHTDEDEESKYLRGPRYHLVDPCSGRNWFMLWIYCPQPKQWIVYREWPSHGHQEAYIHGIGDPGEWAVSGDAYDGIRGPAQQSFGFGLQRYKEEILRAEGSEEIIERWMDARYGNSAKQEREGTTTLIEQMNDLDMEYMAMVSEANILNTNDGSIDMINSALYYDQDTPMGEFSPRLARINQPQLLITENCPNLIWALKNWTGKDGVHGACKDPIDCLRGAFLSELDYIDQEMLAPRNDWMEQFG